MYIDEVSTVSLKALRGRFAPRLLRRMRSVKLVSAGQSKVVQFERAPGHGCVRERLWMVCPRCSRKCSTVGFYGGGIGCVVCLRWRSRNRRVPAEARAPHVGDVAAGQDG